MFRINRPNLSPAAAALIESGMLTPAQVRIVAIRDWHRTREAREAIASFHQQWKALPSRR